MTQGQVFFSFLSLTHSYDRILKRWEKQIPPGEMAEWLKAHVLKTCVGKLTVGSNPSLSAENRIGFCCTRGGARVVEWGRLLSGCRV